MKGVVGTAFLALTILGLSVSLSNAGDINLSVAASLREVIEAGNRIGIDLDCGGGRLVAEVVRQAADELGIKAGGEVYAAIKATAFRKLT